MLSCLSAHGRDKDGFKASVSADITSIILNGNISIGFSHRFSEKWSANGGATLQIPKSSKYDEEKEEHDSMLSESGELPVWKKTYPEFRMGIRFWPEKFLDGPYMAVGCSHGVRSGTDMIVGCGYAAGIWKGLGISAGYEIMLIDSLRNGLLNTKGITIRIHYRF